MKLTFDFSSLTKHSIRSLIIFFFFFLKLFSANTREERLLLRFGSCRMMARGNAGQRCGSRGKIRPLEMARATYDGPPIASIP